LGGGGSRFKSGRPDSCGTNRATLFGVARSLHVRLDDSSAAALHILRSEGLSDSEAVRAALREAAERRRRRSLLRAEVAALAADEDDRREKQAILEEMEALAPDWPE
jgi:Arc/MetJ-type ribon-helix-helix transcriptional regulator